MKTYHFTRRVGADGTVQLSDLPPHEHVEIVIVSPEPRDRRQELADLFADFRQNSPFATMTEEEIMERLRQTREEVWAEQYAEHVPTALHSVRLM